MGNDLIGGARKLWKSVTAKNFGLVQVWSQSINRIFTTRGISKTPDFYSPPILSSSQDTKLLIYRCVKLTLHEWKEEKTVHFLFSFSRPNSNYSRRLAHVSAICPNLLDGRLFCRRWRLLLEAECNVGFQFAQCDRLERFEVDLDLLRIKVWHCLARLDDLHHAAETFACETWMKSFENVKNVVG